MTKLHSLLADEIVKNQNIKDILIKGISCDSRRIKKNYIFAAFCGEKVDGINFINEAINNGAVAVIIDSKTFKNINKNLKIEFIIHKVPRKLYAIICNKLSSYKFKNLIGVTGTNGKTSVAWYVHQFSKYSNSKTASIGTLGTISKRFIKNNTLTTPESEILVSSLDKLYFKNIKNVIIEASSHGLDQFRLDGIKFNIVVITSLSRDHLDYHKNFVNYKKSKIRLFSDFAKNGIAIINDNIKCSSEFIEAAKLNNLRVITIGESSSAKLQYKLKNFSNKLQKIEITYKKTTSIIFSKLIGNFQINNLITAIAIMIEMGFNRKKIEKFAVNLKPPPGRLEHIKSTKGADVYVDFAHTPDAFENVLISIRPYVKNKLYLVFGCGGNRDKGKRSLMGQIAYKYADIVTVTDDNPRFENAASIRKEIIQYCPKSIEISDRKKAIHYSLLRLIKGDILLVAGKGHESTQEIKGKILEFDDVKIIKQLIKEG
jgi:UDP-N-acetylmuramoyl-L-alanyl-D-glutamate--2,6-diaminopimelate ligase